MICKTYRKPNGNNSSNDSRIGRKKERKRGVHANMRNERMIIIIPCSYVIEGRLFSL